MGLIWDDESKVPATVKEEEGEKKISEPTDC